MTYAESELLPHGFHPIEEQMKYVVLAIGRLKIVFDCCCPDVTIKALGCPLHHVGPGGSWPVSDAKKIALAINT